MRERAIGFLLLLFIVPLALVGYAIIVCAGIFGRAERARAGVRALDNFVNATVFNGYAWESVSSHAWRAKDKRWARIVIRLTDLMQEGHCKRANRREQPIVDIIVRKRLHKQTIY